MLCYYITQSSVEVKSECYQRAYESELLYCSRKKYPLLAAHHPVFYLCFQCPSHYKRPCLTFKSLFTKQVTFKSELRSALPAMNSLPHGLLLHKIYKNAMQLTVSVFVLLLRHTLRALYGQGFQPLPIWFSSYQINTIIILRQSQYILWLFICLC